MSCKCGAVIEYKMLKAQIQTFQHEIDDLIAKDRSHIKYYL